MINTYNIEISNSRWMKIVNNSYQKDIYFERNYIKNLSDHYSGTAEMFICEFKDGFYAIPYIKRLITDGYYDLTSSWYYGGPIFSFLPTDEDLKTIRNKFFKFCRNKNIVTAFMYLHPYLGNYRYMFDSDKLVKAGKVVFVATGKKKDIIWDHMKDSRKGSINSSYKYKNLTISFDNSDSKIESFLNIYLKAMHAKKADKFFFFEKSFLVKLRDYYEDNFKLISAIYDNKVIAGNIFLNSHNISYYYLSARELGFEEINAPSRLLYEMIKENAEKDIKYTDLGGGHKSLYNFKKSFSKSNRTKYIYKRIIMEDVYKTLCNSENIKYENAEFFPEYRKGLK